MNSSYKRVGALAFAGMLAIAGCSGESGDAGSPGRDGNDGKDGIPGAESSGLVIEASSVAANADGTISVHFTMNDDRGYPVDTNGVYSVNKPFTPSFSLAYITKDANGKVLPYNVLTRSRHDAGSAFSPGAVTPSSSSTASGTLVQDGQGSYTYTFPGTDSATVAGVAFDPTKLSNTHTLWIQATRQTDPDEPRTMTPVNYQYNFIPSGSGTPEAREVAATAGCNKCHDGFKARTFHGGGRVSANYCGICHNPARASGRDDSGIPAAEAGRFVHRIHYGEHLMLSSSVFHGLDEVTYPQDIRNCKQCHEGAAQGDQWFTRPNRAACGSCHDYVSFVEAAGTRCTDATDVQKAAGCRHSGGPQSTDTTCTTCHDATAIQGYHLPVEPPDPTNLFAGGTNKYTNAAWVAAAGQLPPGASEITYDVESVSTTATGNPSINFKFKKDGQDVVFNAPGGELMDGFVGSPSVYFVWAEPQDGIEKPADFNKSKSGYIKGIRNGSGGTMSADPDANGYYTLTLTGTTIPANATMLTGAIGYSYSLDTTQPLTQIDVPGFEYDTGDYPNKQGGLIVPAPDVYKAATGYTARRAIIDNDKCNACHAPLGVAPNFHVGQRNTGATCSFCHNANKNAEGWSINAKAMIHAIHGAGKRIQPFTWGGGFADVTYPGYLADCQQCHLPGTYDFTSSAFTANNGALVGTLLFSVEANGTVADDEAKSPYLAAGDYTADPVVTSPITSACIACHDGTDARYHMEGNGGVFYKAKSEVPTDADGNIVNTEQCLVCHGNGKIAAVGDVHW